MIALGLDAADATLITRWMEEGSLPTLRSLRDNGIWVTLLHPTAIPSAAVWPSIFTGALPGKHGIIHNLQFDSNSQTIVLTHPSQCVLPPFWRLLDQGGHRSTIVDVPFNYPLSGFAGTQILDWGTYERHYRSHSLPREVLTDIEARFGAYPFGAEMSRDAPWSERRFRRVRAELLQGVRLKGEAIRWLLSGSTWDFFMAVFGETHPAGHYFWNYGASGDDSPKSAAADDGNESIKTVYKAVDEEIAKIVDALDAQTMLLIVSGQGMGENSAHWHFLPEVLSRLGCLATHSAKAGRSGSRLGLRTIRDAISLKLRRSVSRRLPGSLRDRLRLHWANSRIDWPRTRAFDLPTDLFGYIRVNLKGREPQGIVEPGAEYDALCDRIRDALMRLVDQFTGKPIVRDVLRADRVFSGPARNRFPDLLVLWRHETQASTVCSDEIGRISVAFPDQRAGNHKPHGFAIICGHGVDRGQNTSGLIVDIAPTILRYFGLDMPASIDGRPLNCTA
jgi:predicted AlkP superfamily phosphohydrolase/phosphomutase